MKKILSFISAALIGLTITSSGASAASAIAWSPSTSSSSNSHGYPSMEAAMITALNACNAISYGQNDCEIVQSTYRGCIALAIGATHASWSNVWNTPEQAITQALYICGPECVWKQWACN